MPRIRFCLVMLMVLMLCVPAAAGSGEAEQTFGVALETNTSYEKDLYPYAVHGESAVWYLAKADIEQYGLEMLCSGLSGMMENMEQDFADARNALSAYLGEEVPAVRICTDFCNHAAISGDASAYYNGTGNFIKLFHSWDAANASLLHEYVHYLTIACARTPIRFGFWAEGIADYVSGFVCRNRMFRSANLNMTEENAAEARTRGVLDPDGSVDEERAYYLTAEMYTCGEALGMQYYAVANEMITRTEAIQQHPKPDQLSFFEAASMIAFLAETYGEDAVFSHWDSDPEQFEDLFGRSFSELYQDWTAWNTLRCEQLGIITGPLPAAAD